MLPVLFSITFLAGSVLASPKANNFFETVLSDPLQKELAALELDPANINGFTIKFEGIKKSIGNYTGKVEYSKGIMTGLSSAERASDCQGPLKRNGGVFYNCYTTFRDLKVEYEGKMQYGVVKRHKTKGKAHFTDVILYMDVKEPNSKEPGKLMNFKIYNIGHASVAFTDLGPFKEYPRVLEKDFRANVKYMVATIIDQRFQQALGKAFETIIVP